MNGGERAHEHSPAAVSYVSGALLPRSVLDDLTCVDAGRRLRQVPCTGSEALRRRIEETRRRLGPASLWRHLLEVGALPVLTALGWRVGIERTSRERDWSVTPLAGRLAHGSAILVIGDWACDLDRLTRAAAREAERAGDIWAVLYNGTTLRLLDTRRPYTPTYLEASMEAIARHRATRDVVQRLWHPAALGAPDAPGLLDDIVTGAAARATATRGALEAGVHDALGILGNALGAVRQPRATRPSATVDRGADAEVVFQEALTLVFRLLFLLFAEARGLVPLWHPVFRASYSVSALCAALHASHVASTPRGLWPAIQAIGRLAHAGCDFGTLRVVAFNGRLFEPGLLPLAARARVSDTDARRALLALTTVPLRRRQPRRSRREAVEDVRRAISFRDLGVEQLGSVYEGVLDYAPRLDAASDGRLVLDANRRLRKTSGSFYTPRSLTSFLVRRTLAPLVANATPEEILALRVLDPAMGSGAFLVEACGFLANAIERASERADRVRWDEEERTSIRRLVAQRCVYGVDLNPTAAQLARLSLWLAGLAKDRPLSFLDQHLRIGNSLIGATIGDLARPPGQRRGTGRGGARTLDTHQPSLFGGSEFEDAVRWAVPRFRALSAAPDDTPDEVRAKANDFATLQAGGGPLRGWRTLADLWCGAWFCDEGATVTDRGAYFDLAGYCIQGRSDLGVATARGIVERTGAAARAAGAFHWTLEFPEVFFDVEGRQAERGGFDAVLGNPPWEVLHREAANRGSADASAPSARGTEVTRLARFIRESGQYPSADGHLNSYGLFVERALQLVRREGRLGLVLPWGFAVDHGMGGLRRHLFSHAHVDTLAGFDNRQAIFPIHRSMRFALVTATTHVPPRSTSCVLGLTNPSTLDGVRDVGRITGGRWWALTPAFLARAGGLRWAIPDVRDPLDAELLDHVHANVPPLASAEGWCARFGRELHASDDREHFRARGDGLPVVEGKHIDAFRLRPLVDPARIDATVASRLLGGRPFDRPRVAYRDVSSPTNGQVVVAAMLPAGVVSTHTLFCLKTSMSADDAWALCGLLNSTVVSYLAALRMSNHVTTAIMHELPVPRPSSRAARHALARLARRAAAAPAGVERTALDAACARAYGLTTRVYARVLTCRVGDTAAGPYLEAFTRGPGLSSARRSEPD